VSDTEAVPEANVVLDLTDNSKLDAQLRKVTVTFKRRVNLEPLGLPKYNDCELFMSVEDYVPMGTVPAEVVSVLRDLAATVKATVLDELGLEWETTDEDVVLEKIRREFPGAVVQPAASTPVIEATATPALDDKPPFAGEKLDFRKDKEKVAAQREWAAKRFTTLSDPWSEFYDNRQSKRSSRHPDFRHKTFGIGIYESDVKKAGGHSILG